MEKRLDVLDKNLAINTDVEGFVFHDVRKAPFKLYGVYDYEDSETFLRMPAKDALSVSEAVAVMNRYPSGGRIRFKTDAEKIAIRCVMPDWHGGANSTQFSRTGFDFYARENGEYVYIGATCAPIEYRGGEFSSVANLKKTENKLKDVTMYMPLANPVNELYVGIPEGCTLDVGDEYTFKEKRVVYYGSSITMGMGAGRPSTLYQGNISRRFDWDFLNLGFSGNAKGEPEIAEYVANLDMSIFVLDYDHNSPNPGHLKETQMAFYKTVRAKQPDLPIVMCSRPVVNLNQGDDRARFEALWDNYQQGLKAGDKNLYFVKGFEMFLPNAKAESIGDGCHPNDIGYLGMSIAIGDKLQEILEKKIDK